MILNNSPLKKEFFQMILPKTNFLTSILNNTLSDRLVSMDKGKLHHSKVLPLSWYNRLPSPSYSEHYPKKLIYHQPRFKRKGLVRYLN